MILFYDNYLIFIRHNRNHRLFSFVENFDTKKEKIERTLKILTIEEAAKKFGVTTRTIYRWLQNGELEGEKIGGKWFISDDTDLENSDINLENIDDKRGKNDIISKDKLIEQLQTENEYLRKELSQTNQALSEANQQYDESQQRHDEAQQQSNMIIMQLTRQLENQNRMLEDMRNRSLWTRVKAAFSFAS